MTKTKHLVVLAVYKLIMSQEYVIWRANANLGQPHDSIAVVRPNSGVFCFWAIHFYKDDDIMEMYMSKDRKDQENSRNYVTWGMLRGLKMFILVEELREFKLILNTKGNYFLVEEIYSIKFQTWLEPVWRRAGINQVKHILRSMAAIHGMWHPLCECHPCHWMIWSRVVGKMYPKPGCLDPQCSWVSRSIWMQRNEGKNQNKGAALFLQWLCFCLCSV